MNKKKILIVWSSFELGGAERQMMNLADYLKNEKNCEVAFWGMWSGKLEDKLKADGFEVLTMNHKDTPSWSWRWARKMGFLEKYLSWKIWGKWPVRSKTRRWLENWRPEVIISAMNYQNVTWGNLWRRMEGVERFIWNQVDEGIERLDKKSEKKAIMQASKIVCNAKGAKDFLISEYDLERDKVEIIPNIIVFPKIEKTVWQIRRDLGIKKGERVWSMVANLSAFKDHLTLLKAWKNLQNKYELTEIESRKNGDLSKIKIYLAGRDDGQRASLEKFVRENNLSGQVKFLGAIDNVMELLRVSEVAILASNSEGSSNAVAEYMLSGLPIIATKIAANVGLLGRPDRYPLFYEANNTEELAEKMENLINDREMGIKVGMENKLRAEIIFDNEGNLGKYFALLG